MSSALAKFGATVYMNRRDVTPWVQSLKIEQPRRCLYRYFEATFAGWSAVEEGARWDVFATYDPGTTDRAELVIRNGFVPYDRERSMAVARGTQPTLTVRGYDLTWRALRLRPASTIVMLPGSADVASVEAALREHSGPVGRYITWAHMDSMHAAVTALCNRAGLNVSTQVPNHALAPYVVDPAKSYWDAALELVAPFAPNPVIYRRSDNTIVIADPASAPYQLGRTMELPEQLIKAARGLPIKHRRTKRVLVRVPPWR